MKNNHSEVRKKLKLISFCKNRLIANGIKVIENKPISLCKHNEIINTYLNCFGSNPSEDLNTTILKTENTGYVYVLINESFNVCKIGYSKNVLKRISAVQVGSPFPLKIHKVFKGDISLEKALHQKYKSYKTNGEWFRYEGRLKDNLNNAVNCIENIDCITKTTFASDVKRSNKKITVY